MLSPRAAKPVKLFVGLLSGDVDLLRRARQLLTRKYGQIDAESDIWPFDQTDYYATEMGPDLQRTFVSIADLIRPDSLAEIKRETVGLEAQIADETLSVVPRPVNIDPGILDLSKVVLATTKDANHRIYLGSGIYAESTLQYVSGQWQPWPWTYPDYADPRTLAYFTNVRETYRTQRKTFLERREHGGNGEPA